MATAQRQRLVDQTIPEIPKQLDALDEPDAEGALEGLGLYGGRRGRQVRRVHGEFSPRVGAKRHRIENIIWP